jgi:hypothetical protein
VACVATIYGVGSVNLVFLPIAEAREPAARLGVSPERMSISGYGEYRPAASNATLEGRARNRRVDILFVARKDGT